jgi:hypothetical protein
LAEVVRHAVTSHRQISGNAVTSAFTAIHPVLNRKQRRYHVKNLTISMHSQHFFIEIKYLKMAKPTDSRDQLYNIAISAAF